VKPEDGKYIVLFAEAMCRWAVGEGEPKFGGVAVWVDNPEVEGGRTFVCTTAEWFERGMPL
jgi:hypothetical protein